ncbi:hypothetical protein [Streptomyces sp. NPDC001205]
MNDYDFQVSCYGKSHFCSRRAAKRRANQIRRQGGPTFQVYPCRHCPWWHLGSSPGHASHLRTGPHGPVRVEEITS